MCSDSHITKYERGPKISSVSSRRICQTMKVFQNYVKMNTEVLLEVSTMRTESKLTCIRNGTFSNLRSGKHPIHTRQLLHPTCNLRCFITSSPLLCNVMHSLPGLQLYRPLRRKRRVMDSLIVLVQEEHRANNGTCHYADYILH